MTPRLVAIVPAAGLSRRMGQPKLLLDLAGRTVIARVIETLRSAGITRCLVVVRPDDSDLIREVANAGGEVVLPATAPEDMRASVEWALRNVGRIHDETDSNRSSVGFSPRIREDHTPAWAEAHATGTLVERANHSPQILTTPCDGWLLVPADHPTLNPQLVQDLIAAWSTKPSQIAVPVYEGQRGHPTIFPWSLAEEVFRLPPEQGLNAVLRSDPERVHEVAVSDPRVLDDLDTPEDLLRLRAELAQRPVG